MNFKLRCRYFIEMVRKNAELRQEAERQSKSNGASTGMDIDQNGDQGGNAQISVSSDEEILDYGQALQTDFGDGSVASGSNGVLNQLWSLMAYENPLREPHLQHLLDQSGRVEVAEELNVAILCELPVLVPPTLDIH